MYGSNLSIHEWRAIERLRSQLPNPAGVTEIRLSTLVVPTAPRILSVQFMDGRDNPRHHVLQDGATAPSPDGWTSAIVDLYTKRTRA